jgi:transcriptional regulator of acetoin/glycerol metabolism
VALVKRAKGNKLQLAADTAVEKLLREALAKHDGNFSTAAASLGVDRATVHRLVKRLGLDGFVARLRGANATAA